MRLPTSFLTAVLAAGLVLASSAPASAQGALKIGTFDPNKILTDSRLGQKLQDEINQFRVQKETELKRKGEEYKKLVDQYKASAPSMSAERREEIETDLQSKGRDLDREKGDAENELGRRRQKALRDLEEQVSAVIEEYGGKNAYTLIIQKDLCAYSLPAIDVSADIVRLIDARVPVTGTAAARPGAGQR